jgi:SPP1 gp7 family putative phage head morphogenesis protein
MLQGIDLTSLSLDALEDIADAVESFTCKQKPAGEPFHPSYRRNRKLFKKLIRQTVAFKRDMARYFADQYSRIYSLAPLFLVTADEAPEPDTVRASIEAYMSRLDWNEEEKTLSVVLEINLGDIFVTGVKATNLTLQTDLNIGPHTTEEAKFLRDYSVKLSGEITATTKKRITQQIKTSIEVGETRQQLTERINKVLNNPARARAIAQTESIRAYAEGRMAVGRRLKVPYKQLQSFQVDANEICGQVNGDVVPLDAPFKNGLHSPPFHVHCRCSLKLLYSNPNDKNDRPDIPDLSEDMDIFDSAR